MARPKEKETVMTKQGKRTYRLDKVTGKKLTGRPTVFTPEKVQELDNLLSQDVSIESACKFAGVSESAFYEECKRNPEFKERMDKAQELPMILANRTIAKAIRDGDTASAWKMKQSRDKRYRSEGVKIGMQQGIDPETGEAKQWLLVEFTLKE